MITTNELIEKYFGARLSDRQKEQFNLMGELYKEWNAKINVISRKDIDNVYLHHILHSLAISKIADFPDGSTVMDIGCGGGFPGVPLAVLYPNVTFKMIDSIGKKITVVREVSAGLGLTNIETYHSRAEEVKQQTDYVVSRAVTELSSFMDWSWNKIRGGENRGLIYLKGGDLQEEIKNGIAGRKKIESVDLFDISSFYSEEFFETKKILYIKKQLK